MTGGDPERIVTDIAGYMGIYLRVYISEGISQALIPVGRRNRAFLFMERNYPAKSPGEEIKR